MKIQKLNIRGTEMNKIRFAEIESYLEERGLDVNSAFAQMADENEFVYVSNGFINGLVRDEKQDGEWHHFFKKDTEGHFIAGKLQF